jgi:hypothetical protein
MRRQSTDSRSVQVEGVPFDADQARRAWVELGYTEDLARLQDRIVKEAFKGRWVVDTQVPNVADIAVGWAWAVLGPPWSRRHHRWYAYVWTNVIRPGPCPGPSYMAYIYGAPEDDRIVGVRRAARKVEWVYLHTPPPAAAYRRPEPGENLKPEWLRRILWGPRPRDADPNQRAD